MGTIRFVLALSVVAWHVPNAPFRLLNATVAVLGFFMVSGFYMAMVLTEKYHDARSFYVARFWRLYPAYAATAAFMVWWYATHNTPTVFTDRVPIPAGEQVVLAFTNFAVIGQDIMEFWREAFGARTGFFYSGWMLIGQAWSLSSEFFFYCLAPFVVRSPPRILALLAASLAVRALTIGWFGLPSWIWGYYFFPGSLCMFLLGSLTYHLGSMIKSRHGTVLARAIATGWAGWLIYGVATVGVMLPYGPGASADGAIFWIAYIAFAASLPILFSWSKDSRIDRAIGDLSYPLYLVHGLVVGYVFSGWDLPQGKILSVLVAISASIVAAIVLRVAVELPTEVLRARRA